MNNERYTQIISSVLVAILLFAVGFYAGKKNSVSLPPPDLLSATSTETIDMAPFWKAWNILDQKIGRAHV